MDRQQVEGVTASSESPGDNMLDEFKYVGHGIIQRQITQKRYKIELYLQWRTNKQSYMVYRTAPIRNNLEQSLTQFSKSPYSLTLNIS